MKLGRFAAIAFATLWTGVAGAQGWPTKPVRIVVPFTAGSATDILARTYGQKLQEYWGQPVIIDNLPARVARSARASSRSHPATATRCSCIPQRTR